MDIYNISEIHNYLEFRIFDLSLKGMYGDIDKSVWIRLYLNNCNNVQTTVSLHWKFLSPVPKTIHISS